MTKVLCAGSLVCDFIAAGLPYIAQPGELVYAPYGIEFSPGGHSANVSVDLTQLGQGDVSAVGSVGDDLLGDFLEGELRRRGVVTYAERIEGAHTAKNIALIVEGEDRRFIAELTANTMLSPSHVISALEDSRPDAFYLGTVGGLRHVDQSLIEVLSAGRSLGSLTLVDVVMPHGLGWDRLTPALPLIDVLHCNELEGAAMTGSSDVSASADILLGEGVGLVLITRGPGGLLAATGGLKLEMPAFKVEAVDPTGAGDAFCAGVIHALLSHSVNRDSLGSIPLDILERVLLEGQAAGAACVTAIGAVTAVTRNVVDGLIGEQGEAILAAARAI